MSPRIVSLSALLFVLAACGQENPPPPPPPPGVVPGQPIVPVPIQPGQPGQPVIPGQPGQPVVPVQPVIPGQPGMPTSITLSQGFVPDPHIVRGSSGGPVQASNLSAPCMGWISQNPNHLFNAATPFTNVRFVINAGTADTTLVIQRPDGSYLCNDDSDGMNPIVQGPLPVAGVHRIWVGSYDRSQSLPYTLGITENAGMTSAMLVGGAPGVPPSNPLAPANLDTTGSQANFGTVSLAPGFLPDPNIHNGTSGGSVSVASVTSGCSGFVARTPDHLVDITGAGFPNLRVMAHSDTDTTLVVHKPDGTYLCNDDSEGRDPLVSGAFPPGRYRVWVGSYSQGDNGSYRLGFSVQPGVTPSRLQ